MIDDKDLKKLETLVEKAIVPPNAMKVIAEERENKQALEDLDEYTTRKAISDVASKNAIVISGEGSIDAIGDAVQVGDSRSLWRRRLNQDHENNTDDSSNIKKRIPLNITAEDRRDGNERRPVDTQFFNDRRLSSPTYNKEEYAELMNGIYGLFSIYAPYNVKFNTKSHIDRIHLELTLNSIPNVIQTTGYTLVIDDKFDRVRISDALNTIVSNLLNTVIVDSDIYNMALSAKDIVFTRFNKNETPEDKHDNNR